MELSLTMMAEVATARVEAKKVLIWILLLFKSVLIYKLDQDWLA